MRLFFAFAALAAFACAAPSGPDYSQCDLDVVSDESGNGVIDLPDVLICLDRLKS